MIHLCPLYSNRTVTVIADPPDYGISNKTSYNTEDILHYVKSSISRRFHIMQYNSFTVFQLAKSLIDSQLT